MIKPLGIYSVKVWGKTLRLIPTGNQVGVLYEFKDCTDLKRDPLHYPEENVKLIYDGNCSAPDVDEYRAFKL